MRIRIISSLTLLAFAAALTICAMAGSASVADATGAKPQSITETKTGIEIIRFDSIEEFETITNGYFYFGRDNCEDCQRLKETLATLTPEKHLELWYFDINYLKSIGCEEAQKTHDILVKYGIDFIPTVVYIEDGKVQNTLELSGIVDMRSALLDFLFDNEKGD